MNALAGTSLAPRYMPARSGDVWYSRLDNNKASRLLVWKPKYDFVTGLSETLTYYKEQRR
ncbi:hypothetical protein [Paenibacillus beijingensis]|uniref:Uncharacterized protein n=1 Tax=Paenibacillus beijingensis TaxID=1126833 RepID=A0A0D5NGF1_9BACL|nr:hypothetical protein [Paenibacillus beijingensis]AJY74190.1 hypothetical protein VN24_05865 [Paenibacillus beijingensis]